LPLLFAVTLFVSASLLFLVQPMIGKMVLPLLGGSPAVWNTCMLFFQAVLLAGYLYAHAITQRLGRRAQFVLHMVVLLLPLVPLVLLGFDAAGVARTWLPPPAESNPVGWLLTLLLLTAGLPFFVVATSAPLLQRWFSDTGHPAGKDPYFLYAASNLGSMLALLGYPLFVEPNLTLATQTKLWVTNYGLLVLLTAVCGLMILRPRAAAPVSSASEPDNGTALELPTALRRVRWVALAFVPSSLMLGVTTYVTTDVAAIPLLWIIPLALYLLSFILVFSKLPAWLGILFGVLALGLASVLVLDAYFTTGIVDGLVQHVPLSFVQMQWLLRGAVALCLLLFLVAFPVWLRVVMLVVLPLSIFVLLFPPPWDLTWLTESLGWREIGMPPLQHWQLIGLHFLAMFAAAMVCHGELARTRPPAAYLTGFYLLMSLGGVLGGVFNALVAPVVFNKVVEYPLVIALACLLLPRPGFDRNRALGRGLDLTYAGVLGVFGLFVAAAYVGRAFIPKSAVADLSPPFRAWATHILDVTSFTRQETIYRNRNFFGVVHVDTWDNGRYHYLVHGTTSHGMQCMEPGRQDEPMAYFHREGPIGRIFEAVGEKKSKVNMAVLGIGTGTLAAYALPGWDLTLYEIDPAIVQMAFDRKNFTYLDDCKKRQVPIDIRMGDGRLQLRQAPEGTYDILFMDAFTSDAVPVHLITKEAIEMYFTKLAPGGIVVVNIANRYLDLEPVLANLAEATGLCALAAKDEGDRNERYGTHWVVFARKPEDFGRLPQMTRDDGSNWFEELKGDERVGVWTDDFSNLIRVFRWRD
jgi:hypothetical protein